MTVDNQYQAHAANIQSSVNEEILHKGVVDQDVFQGPEVASG